MTNPKSFKVNDTWIAFQLNGQPIATESDGAVNVLTLMDAASSYLFGTLVVRADHRQPNSGEAIQLLQSGYAHVHQWPVQLIVPVGLLLDELVAEATRLGIAVDYLDEDQLLPLVTDARQSFNHRMNW